MFEVEQKFHVESAEAIIDALRRVGAVVGEVQQHRDHYFNHPAKDFAQTGEALRVRRVNGTPMITYKGPKLPGEIKARREMEWRLDPGDSDGASTEELLTTLGFRSVATVKKQRRSFHLPNADHQSDAESTLFVVIDEVESLGTFAEIELVVDDQSGVEEARTRIETLARSLDLGPAEPRSYLRMILGE